MIIEGPNMCMDVVAGRTLVFVHDKNKPSDSDFSKIVDISKKIIDIEKTNCLVITDGGSPTPAQRKMMSQNLGEGVRLQTAILTSSLAVRFVVSAITLVNSKVKSFEPTESKLAFDYLGLDMENRALVVNVLSRATKKGDFLTAKKVLESYIAIDRKTL